MGFSKLIADGTRVYLLSFYIGALTCVIMFKPYCLAMSFTFRFLYWEVGTTLNYYHSWRVTNAS